MNKSNICLIQFKFECDINRYKKYEVYVTGNINQLGFWNVNKSEKLKRMSNNLFMTRENIYSTQSTIIEYKYFFRLNDHIIWEDNVNRIINTNNNIRMIVYDNDDKNIKSKIEYSTIDPNINNKDDNYESDDIAEKKEGFDLEDKKPRIVHYINPNQVLYEEYYSFNNDNENRSSIEEMNLNLGENNYSPERENEKKMEIVERSEYDLIQFKERKGKNKYDQKDMSSIEKKNIKTNTISHTGGTSFNLYKQLFNNNKSIIERDYFSDDYDSKSFSSSLSNGKTNGQNLKEKLFNSYDIGILIILTLYLPCSISKNKDNEFVIEVNDDSFYGIIYNIISKKYNFIWIGLLDTRTFSFNIKEENMDLIQFELKKKSFYWLNTIENEEIDNFNFFIDNYLAGIFHYNSYINNIRLINSFDKSWQVYKFVNEEFSKVIFKFLITDKVNLVWIQDFHFLLSPSKIRSVLKNMNNSFKLYIGLHLHEPFPSFEVFMKFQFKDDIIKSMLSVDLLGFHTFTTSRNFFNLCKRYLKTLVQTTEKGNLALVFKGKIVIIHVSNIYHEPIIVKELCDKENSIKNYKIIKEKYKNKIIILSYINLKYESFLNLQLKVISKLLIDLRTDSKHLLFSFIFLTENKHRQYSKVSNYENKIKYDEETTKLINNIHSLIGDGNLIFVDKEKLTCYERIAYLMASDIFINLNFRGKYNLISFEYLIIKKHLYSLSPLFNFIISVNSGESSSISSAIKVNPLDFSNVLSGFTKAIERFISKYNKLEELEQLQRLDFIHSDNFTCSKWILSSLSILTSNHIIKQDANIYVENFGYFNDDKVGQLSLNLQERLSKVIKQDLCNSLLINKSKLILIDFEGALLVRNFNSIIDIKKSYSYFNKIIRILNAISNDSNNIFIIGGKESIFLKEFINEKPIEEISKIGFAIEYGYLYKLPKENNWKQIIKKSSTTWIIDLRKIMENYCDRCLGAYVEIKNSSIVWVYKDCDYEMGSILSNMLIEECQLLIKENSLSVINGRGYVEIKPKKLNKGWFISYILNSSLKKEIRYENIYYFGIDNDESLSIFLEKLKKSNYNSKLYNFTASIGKSQSRAKFYFENHNEFKDILESVYFQSKNKN